MSGSGDSEDAEDFLYTPHGVATVTVAAVILISLVWLSGCGCYCWWRYRRSHCNGAVASRDIFNSPHNGTLAGGTDTTTAYFSYSVNSLASEPAFHHTSLESILCGEAELKTPDPA